MTAISDDRPASPSVEDVDVYLKRAIIFSDNMSAVSKYFDSISLDRNKPTSTLSFSGPDMRDTLGRLGAASAGLSLSQISKARDLGALIDGAKAKHHLSADLKSLCNAINSGDQVIHVLDSQWKDEALETDPAKSFWSAGWHKAIDDCERPGMTADDWSNTAIAAWLRRNASYGFIDSEKISNHMQQHQIWATNKRGRFPGNPPGNCFIPGTQVMTSTGSVAIEDLKEGASVLTRCSPAPWGVRSSEIVRNPSPDHIYGINKQPAFFTAGHVFHTTTGLRAVDPEIARQENSWIDVAHLQPGHMLLHTQDGQSYEQVLVQSIEMEKPRHEFVYGVHLREGLRSYHANGYLVALNYPEITLSSIVDRLKLFPAHERLRMMDGLKIIGPLLAHFGGPNVHGTIEEQLSTGQSKKRRGDEIDDNSNLPPV